MQNPHGLPPASVPSGSATKKVDKPSKEVSSKPALVAGAAALKEKEKLPCTPKPFLSFFLSTNHVLKGNVSPYSSGLPGASLTSTSVDPTTRTSRLLWDEEELMFEAISNPPKSKSKEADVGKRRAYVRMVTSLGGSLNLELYCEKVPIYPIN